MSGIGRRMRTLGRGGGGGVQIENFSLEGQKHTLAGHRGPFFLLAGQMCLFTIYCPPLAGHFFSPFMARGLLFEKHWYTQFTHTLAWFVELCGFCVTAKKLNCDSCHTACAVHQIEIPKEMTTIRFTFAGECISINRYHQELL